MNEIELVEIQEKDLELIVSEKTLGHITTNAKQIKELVKSALPKYDIANYSEDNIDEAKKDRALLNNSAKILNEKRLEFEREFMKPFIEFKEVVADTVKLIGECTAKIDTVIKGSEQKAKDQKRALILKYWNEKEFTLVKFERVFDEKWLNKTSKEKDIYIEIDSKIAKIKDDILTLEAIGEDIDLLKSLYLDTLNINNTIQYANTLKQNRQRVKEEAEKHVEKVPEPEVKNPEPVIPVQSVPVQSPAPVAPEMLTRAFKVFGTRDQIIALSNFMNESGIRFEKIELC
jgi:hypothetical protein